MPICGNVPCCTWKITVLRMENLCYHVASGTIAMIGGIMRTAYICTLDGKIQSAIKNDLTELGLCAEDISRAMDSRLCDLEDTIDIEKYL